MSPRYYKSKSYLGDLLDTYSSEGISVLASEPSKWMRAVLVVLAAIFISAFIWSFIGKADVIVKARGSIAPEGASYKLQTPIKGEIKDIYVAEGMPVAKGDILVSIFSQRAIQVAAATANNEGAYEKAKLAYESFPAKQKIREKDLALLKSKIEQDRVLQEKLETEAIAQLGEEQSIKLKKARAKLAKAEDTRNLSRTALASHERLFASPGGGGISRQQLNKKRNEYNANQLDYELALAEMGEFEVGLSKEYNKRIADMQKRAHQLVSLESQYQNGLLALDSEKKSVVAELRLARSRYLSSSSVTFDDVDENSNLRLRAPMDGLVTQLLIEQTGISVEDKTPIMVLAPENTRKVLEVAIREKDRAFLRAGMPVKIKLDAFSYQQFGLLSGELEYISPVTTTDPNTKRDYYTGRVGLAKDFFTINGDKTPIRYGMKAEAEITVRQRRIIDIVLDPIRNIAG